MGKILVAIKSREMKELVLKKIGNTEVKFSVSSASDFIEFTKCLETEIIDIALIGIDFYIKENLINYPNIFPGSQENKMKVILITISKQNDLVCFSRIDFQNEFQKETCSCPLLGILRDSECKKRNSNNKILIKGIKDIHHIWPKDIQYIEKNGRNTIMEIKNVGIVTTKVPVKDIERKLGNQFCTIYKGIIINVNQIEKVIYGNNKVKLLDVGKELPISRRHLKDIKQLLFQKN